jgi:Icc-related predicted phosphoesterase
VRPEGQELFRFVVVADTHVNQEEGYSSSPYPCNALANARTRRVVAEINHLAPDFVIHLGDIVNPVPELPSYSQAAKHFQDLVADLEAPLYLVPGNHDVGDKPLSWMPAGQVSEAHLELYESFFGKDHYAFCHKEMLFITINAPIINSGLAAEEKQKAWLEETLAENHGRRTFLSIHYPPYVSNRDEPSSYDNIDEPGRSWLLGLIARYQPEAIFCGHVHNFWYDQIDRSELYILPSTAFVRHDYAEFYRVEPGDQFGRNDAAKLGYFLVQVFEQGHLARNIRSYGRCLDPGESLTPAAAPPAEAPHSKSSQLTNFGVDLRHPWAEEMEIAPSGALDEFERKLARNDYPLLALWEMGLRLLRVPLQDLTNQKTRRRMEMLTRLGHLFQVHCYGQPGEAAMKLLRQQAHLIHRLELVLDWQEAEIALPQIRALREKTGLSIRLSRINRKDAAKAEGGRYNHLISHGFSLAELPELEAFAPEAGDAIEGFVVSLRRDDSLWQAAGDLSDLRDRCGLSFTLYARSNNASPAEAFLDDQANAARALEALLAAMAYPMNDIILDCFTDSDRGYFARHGLVDRRYNPRAGSVAITRAIGLLATSDIPWYSAESFPEAAVAALTNGELELTLFPDSATAEAFKSYHAAMHTPSDRIEVLTDDQVLEGPCFLITDRSATPLKGSPHTRSALCDENV